MSWAQENKGLTAFIALTVVSAGGLGYLLYDGWSRDSEQTAKWNSVRDTVQALERQPLYPNAQNVTLKKEDAETFKKVVFNLRTDLAKNQPQLKELSDTQFQQRLKQDIEQTRAAATGKNIRLPDVFAFGFNNYVSGLPKIEASSELEFQLTGATTLASYLVDAGVSSIEAMERTPLPIEEGREAVKPNAKAAVAVPEKVTEKSTLKVIFRAKQSALQQVLFHLSNAPKPGAPYLFTRLVRIENEEKKGPSNQESFQPHPISQDSNNITTAAVSGASAFNAPPVETVAPASSEATAPVPASPTPAPGAPAVPAAVKSTTPGPVPAPAPAVRGTSSMTAEPVVNRIFAQIPPAPKPGAAPAAAAVSAPASSIAAPAPATAAAGTPSPASATGTDPSLNSAFPVKPAEPMIDTRIILGNEELVVYLEVDLIRYLAPTKDAK